MSSNALQLIHSQYGSDSDTDSDSNSIQVITGRRSREPSPDESSSSSSSDWCLSSSEDSDEDIDKHKDVECITIEDDENKEFNNEQTTTRNKPKRQIKTKGELSLDDLPPIEKLTISVKIEELTQLGTISSIVDQLVVIQSFRLMPALDLDSVLFFNNGQPLGQIFDVFGPVIEPRYAVRFNSNQDIVDDNIIVGQPIYYAPQQQQPITGFIFAEQLRRLKGSDASWRHNNEPPEDCIEFSDDEAERQTMKKLRAKRPHNQLKQQKRPQNKSINHSKQTVNYYNHTNTAPIDQALPTSIVQSAMQTVVNGTDNQQMNQNNGVLDNVIPAQCQPTTQQ
ncbi:H/ACA ribonucleoprotein complex non-core subunit NAF1-like, partial [Oppia nitens]|uniref:H/ACA ribonucleoprotein complex non-core subunit NAF1-like n=1 Tax=Oppia nitens TaxID=1686743 RepID=UPI0023DA8E91